MKKHLLMLFAVIVAATMSLRAQTIVIDDGFENGIQDSVWTQEFVRGEHPWAVETLGEDSILWPASIWQGSKRAYLRNTSGETQGYVTRLVSKVMDLRPEKVYQPELTFWYANPKWTADRDTLRVLYRTNQNAQWKQLAEFSKASANWQKVKLELPEVNETYQIAFEGTDNLGRGIVLDSVKLRSAPECTVPHDISVNSKGAGLVNIAWVASWDAVKFELIVSKNQINPDTVNLIPDSTGIIAFHELVDGTKQNYDVQLESGEYYYIYLRSLCELENSTWNSEDPAQGSKPYYFRVKATKNVPYAYGFDMPYEAGILRRDLEWTWRGNTGNFNPFVNVGVAVADRDKYSKSGTSCVVFSGTSKSEPAASDAIPANKYAYVATPALADTANANFALNQCVVSFTGTVYQYTGRNYAHSLIVGAMTDPEDITTFVPVDTVSIWGTSTFEDFVVDLSSYQGDGNYVCFMSDFDTKNIFFLDDVAITYKSALQVPTGIKVNPRDNWADISWNGNASSYKIMITNEEVNPDKAEASQIVDATEVTTNSYKTEALEADHSWNRPYYVYVKAMNASDTSAWSYRYPFVTIAAKKAVPYSFDFEQKPGQTYTIGENATQYPTEIGIFSNDPEYPHLVTSNVHAGSACLNLTKDWGNDSWITLPMVDSLTDLQVTFYLSGSGTPMQARATLGVMTNPMDFSTFIPVSECKVASSGYTTAYANFQNYDGPQGILAIAWADVDGGKQTINYIDDLTVDSIAKCLPPVNVQLEAGSDSVTVRWDKSEATTWEFVLSDKSLSSDQIEKLTFDSIGRLASTIYADTLLWDDVLNNPIFGFNGLDYNTPYYIYVRTLCGEEKTYWVAASFATPCPTDFPIPFYDDFESYESVNLTIGCWTVRNQGATTYPKVTTLSVTGSDSKKAVDLYSTSTGSSYMAMPGVNGDLSNLLLTFDVRTWGSSVTTAPKALLIVGSMADFEDPSTFVGLDTFYLCGSATYENIKMNLADYNLTYNNIVFTSGLPGFADRLPAGISFTTSDVALDNVSLKPNTCIEAWKVEATNIQTDSIAIKWQGKSNNDEWYVKVMQDTNLIALDTVIGKTYLVAGLEPVKEYTFYIKPNCDTTWAEASFMTACVKLDPSKPNKETFEDYPSGTSYNVDYAAPCWTVGINSATAAATNNPYIYKSTTYASSGTNVYRINESSTYAPAWVASPEIDIDHMKNLAVSFTFYATTSYYGVFGVMSDPTDLSTFVALDSVKGTAAKVALTYDLSEYADSIPATAKYFGWRGRYAAADLFYIDDVSIIKVTCPYPKPSYSGLTAEQVRISSGLRTDNEWIMLAVDTAAFTADQLALLNVDSLVNNDSTWQAHVIAYDTIDERVKVLTGLKEQTDYYVAVATVCEEGISPWSIISFKTPCKAITPEAMGTITFSKKDGYVSGSSATRYLPCWTIGNKSGNAAATSTYIPYVYTSSTYLHNGDSVLYLNSYVPTSATSTAYNGAYAIMPELDVEDIAKYQVNFWARATTTASYGTKLIVGVVTDPSDLNTFVVVDTLTTSHSAYEPFSVSIEDYQGDYLGNKGRYIMFLSECDGVTYNQIYIASISVEAIPTCRPVTEFKVDSVAEDAAMISWKQYSDSYRMLLADKEVAEDKKATYEWLLDTVVTKTDSVLLAGLQPNAHYYVYAQALCEGGDSSAISMAYAHILTDCPAEKGFAAPYYVDFDNNSATGSGKRPDCWEGVYLTFDTVGTTQTYPYVYSLKASSVSEPYVLYMYSYGYWNNTDKKFTSNTKSIAVAPKVAGNLADYMVSFYAKKTSATNTATSKYGGKIWIGYVTDASQHGMDSTFVKIAAVDVATTTQAPYQLILGDYINTVPEGARLALRADWSAQDFPETYTGNTSMYANFYIDNFKIGMPPACFPPTLEPGNTSLTTADVTIVPAKAWNDKWQIAVVPDSIYSKDGYDAAAYLAGNEVRIVDADSANFTISDLTAGTLYWLYARTVCGGEDGNSAWTDLAVSTRTKYYYADSYFFGFEQEEGWERSPLSTSDSYIIHPALEAGYVQLGSAITSYSYMPHALLTTSSGYNYGYGPSDGSMGKTGIRWNATTSYYGQYVIMPALNEAKARSFEFKFRNGYSYVSSGKYIVSTSYDVSIEVGTVDKFKGMETYQKLATISMEKYPSSSEATEANDWLWRSYTLDLDSATIADKQIVFYQAEKPSASNYPYIDNVTMGAPKGFGLVSLDKIKTESTSATVTWDNLGGPWNLYILKANGDTLSKFENLSGVTSQEVTGLTPQSTYTAILVAAEAPKDTKYMTSSTKEFKTPCLPLNANAYGEFVWNFDDPSGWERSDVLVGGTTATDTAYYKPECFTVGTTYASAQTTTSVSYNWLVQRKGYTYASAPTSYSSSYTHYEVGRGDSYAAMRVYTSSTYMTPYLVLPELNCSFDTMMIEFWGRCFINYDDTYGTAASRNKMVSATYLGSSYSKSMVVGTLTDPHDFSTLQVIDTVTYTAYTSTTAGFVTDDKTGNRYWQKFQLPLGGAKGKYIVLFQPAYGLFIMDDLKIAPVGDNLFAPSGANTSNVTTNSATFSWDAKHPSIQTVVVVTDQYDEEIIRDTIAGNIMTYTVDTLKPNSSYQWYVYQTNGTVNTMATGNQAFYTECVAVGTDYKTGFELNEGWKLVPGATSDTYKQTLCWTYGNAGSTTAWSSSFPYNYANTSSYVYSYEGAYAPRLYASGTTYQTYITMPAIEDIAAYDTLQVNFMMRPGYHVPSTGKISTTYAYYSSNDHYYAKSVIVGTMTDPNDASTFVAIDTITYNGEFTTSDYATAANDYLFQKCKVALAGAQGKYVTIMASFYRKGDTEKCTSDYMWLDNVSFSAVQHCNAPVEMTSSEISATEATLSWEAPEGASKYILQVSTDYTYAEDSAFVFNDTVDQNSVIVNGLKAYTQYAWRVRTICAEDLGESEFSQNASFITARQPFFIENFGATNLDADWSFGTTPAVEVIDSADVEITGANNATYGFKRVTTNYGIEGAHYVVPCYTSSNTTTTYRYYWMISPVISLDADKTSQLTFDIALTAVSSSTPNANPVTEANMADDYTFMVLLSEDGGKTWKKENVLAIWNNTLPAGNQLRDIPSTAANLRFDLTKYAGKNVRIAFYREAFTYISANCGIHLDNIRINYFDVIEDNAAACQYQDIDKLGFYIDGDIAAAGDTTYRRMEKAYDFDANTKGYRDSLYLLNVTYIGVAETIVNDTICEGDTYTDLNFHGKDRTGVYRRKLQSVESCDSLVTLYLYVTPRAYAEDEIQSVCPGETYTWNGKVYDRAGLYRDTTVSAAGCDSIQTLVLQYFDPEDTITDAVRVPIDSLPYTYQNEQYPYAAGQAPIIIPAGSAKGDYIENAMVQGQNCTAYIIVTITVYDEHEGINNIDIDADGTHKIIYRDNMYIKTNGSWYNASGQKVADPRK